MIVPEALAGRSVWQLRADLAWAHGLLFFASSGRDGREPKRDVHLFMADRYGGLSDYYIGLGNFAKAKRMSVKAGWHYRAAGPDDPPRAMAILSQLHEMGVRLAIDDFGTGYSSLAYLRRLAVHTLKIDRSFVLDMNTDSNAVAIVQSVIDLGHNLGLQVVAEGVEDQLTCDVLRALGCDLLQGYYLSRPLPAVDLQCWLPRFETPYVNHGNRTPNT